MLGGFVWDFRPVEARPPRGKIQAGYWRGFKELVGRMGGSHGRILERHDIDPSTFEFYDCHVDCGAALEVLEYCSYHLDDPLFGLHLADTQQADAFGSVAVLAKAAPTFGEALRCLVDYTPIVNSPEGRMELVRSNSYVELRWSSDLAGSSCEQSHYHGLLLIMKTLRSLGGARFAADKVSLCCDAAPRLRSEIEQKVACKLITRAGANAIAFSPALLDEPNPSRNAMVYRLLGSCLAQLAESPVQSMVEEVEYFIRATLPSGHCTIERCAERLESSTRTLQKALASRDTSFSQMLERQRQMLARKALAHSEASIDDIAFNLGYAEQSSFGRAFKRWTGLSPKSYRRRERASR